MTHKNLIVTTVMLLIALAGCQQKSILERVVTEGHLERLTLTSPAIADNSIGDNGTRNIYVMLPPGYAAAKQRYPVIYSFHGQGGDSTEMLRWEESVYASMEKKQVPPFILVAVNGDNPLGGTFYVNGRNSGRWEDHLTGELIPLIDRRYRTLPMPESRGLMGFSMGGFGVLHNGMTHSDLFGAVWALCPGVLVPETGLDEAMTSWKGTGGTFLRCYAAAFSADQAQPAMDGSLEDQSVRQEWENGFGNWNPRMAAWKSARADGSGKLAAVRIVAGSMDMFTWITEGSRWLASELEREQLPVEFAELNIGHTIGAGTVKNDAMEFFARTLKREP